MFYERRRWINRGFLAGPICPMYGLCLVLMAAVLAPLQNHLLPLFLCGALLASAFELASGWLIEKVFRTRLWDYSDRRVHLMGHICLEFSLAWGLMAAVVLHYVHPHTARWIASIPRDGRLALTCILSVVHPVDTLFSIGAALRKKREAAREAAPRR